MRKQITGSWFEFCHHNRLEGKYLNPVCRRWTEEQWRTKLCEMAELGMKYLVLTFTSLKDDDFSESYFEDGPFPFPSDFACSDPIGVMLDEADRLNMRVFMSVGFYGIWTHTEENMTSEAVTERAFDAMRTLYQRYGAHPSFYGWYYPDETCIDPYFSDEFIDYVNRYSAFAHTLSPGLKTMIAPYGTCRLHADEHYVEQLTSLDVDIIAYQDEVGVQKTTPEQTGAFYDALRKAHDKAGRAALWADVELFAFEGTVYQSALIPADIDRLTHQIDAICDYVDEILVYEYIGIMNKPSTIAYAGHPDSVSYYEDYKQAISKNAQEE